MPSAPAVLSLNVQAAMQRNLRPQRQFEVMVRHLFDRMMNNEAFGEDAAARTTELAGAIAVPGLLVALLLFPAYHLPGIPHPPRPLMSQACDHLFFCTYSFVILGLAMVFQWETLFPDMLDIYVLTSLPIERRHMLWGRITALAIFLGLVQVETSILGTIFLPAVADLKLGFFHHAVAHGVAVTLSGAFAAAFFLALQGILGCIPFYWLASRIAAAVKIVSVIVLLTVLFLFPLASQSIEALLASSSPLAHFLPPLWFLGVYECLLYGSGAPSVFHHLAYTGLWTTAAFAAVGVLLYPFAYGRRVHHLIEGMSTSARAKSTLLDGPFHAFVIRTPAARAIFHYTAQTLARLPRLHLYMAMYAGVGLALMLSELLNFRMVNGHTQIVVPVNGVRMVFPLVAFWTVMGLRTALLSPLLLKGSWLFRVIDGSANEEGLRAARTLVVTIASCLILVATAILHFIEPREMRTVSTTVTELLLGLGLSLILTDVAFLLLRTIPFTTARLKTVHQLPIALVIYLVVFPFFALQVQALALWNDPTPLRIAHAALTLGVIHALLRMARRYVLNMDPPVPDFLYLGLGLRDEP
jgi:hypothetical protein